MPRPTGPFTCGILPNRTFKTLNAIKQQQGEAWTQKTVIVAGIIALEWLQANDYTAYEAVTQEAEKIARRKKVDAPPA